MKIVSYLRLPTFASLSRVGSECKIWFKAEPINDSDKLYHLENIPINIKATPSVGNPVEINLLADTDQALYIGGEFSYNNHVTKWNGNSWVALSDGITGKVFAIETREDNGDIYIGGNFQDPGKYAVLWNGNNWKNLNSELNSTVSDFLYHDDGSNKYLYVGGAFSTPGNKIFRCNLVNNNCSSLPNTPAFSENDEIYTILFKNDQEMFIGGSFSSGNNVKHYRNNTGVWSNLDSGVDSSVLAISTPVDESTIGLDGTYFGGSFNYASGDYHPAFATWRKKIISSSYEWNMTQNDPGFSSSDTVRVSIP